MSGDILETVRVRMLSKTINRKRYVTYQIAALAITLSDLHCSHLLQTLD